MILPCDAANGDAFPDDGKELEFKVVLADAVSDEWPYWNPILLPHVIRTVVLDNGREATGSIKATTQSAAEESAAQEAASSRAAEEAAATQASEEATARCKADEELQARQTELEAHRQAAQASEEAAAKDVAHEAVVRKVIRLAVFRQKPRQVTKTEVRVRQACEGGSRGRIPGADHRGPTGGVPGDH